MESLSHRKRSRVDSDESVSLTESAFNSPKVKRIRDDLLSLLDDPETVPERESLSHDLDSVIRSFEEEISGSGSSSPAPANLVGENAPEFGEFSKDELTRVSNESGGIGELWEFRDELTSYDPFEFGLDYEESVVPGDSMGNGSDYLALDGLFDYPDVSFGSDFSWRSETLPAL